MGVPLSTSWVGFGRLVCSRVLVVDVDDAYKRGRVVVCVAVIDLGRRVEEAPDRAFL